MTLAQDRIGLCKTLDDGRVLRVREGTDYAVLTLSVSQESPTWSEGWWYVSVEAAIRDLLNWEPGGTLICVLCERERGGADPPGPWFRHRPSRRRREPIFGENLEVLGYLEYVYV